jgi:hypothetical protein
MASKDIGSWLSTKSEDAPESTASESVAPGSAARSSARGHELGEPLDITQAASLIGCSPWTVRHTLIPKGLPCFRTGANGKLIFYEQQVVRWVLRNQRLQGGQP